MGYTSEGIADFSANKKMARISLFLVAMFSLSIIPISTVSANANIDLGFEETENLQNGVSYPIEDLITIEIYVKNLDNDEAFNAIKWIEWDFCSGDMSATGCDENNIIENGTKFTANIAPNSRKLISFSTFQPVNSGDYTLEVRFEDNDVNPTNDEMYVVITIVDAFTDFVVDTSYDILPEVANLNVYNGDTIYNSNKDYPLFLNGSVENWQQNSPAQIGWQLLDGDVVFAEAMTNTINFPTQTEELTSFSVELPFLNSPREGFFWLKYGLFTPGEDMNHLNNQHSRQIIFDDTLDITINTPESVINPEDGVWYAGLNSMKVVVKNNGNVSSYNYDLELEQIYDGSYTDIIQICGDIDLHPGESEICYFDLLNPGLTNLTLTIDEAYQSYYDENTEDNRILIPTEIIAGELNASVILEREDGIFTFDDTIHLVASVSSNAPTPLTFDWARNGWSMASGDDVNLTARHMGTGTHQMTLTVTDSLDRVIFVDFELVIVNTTFFSYGGDMIYGVAPTRSTAYVDIDFELVPELFKYSIDESLTPLYTLDVDAINSLNPGQDPGLERLEMTLDLDKLLPKEVVDNSSIKLYWIENITDDTPVELNADYITLVQDDGLYHIRTPTDGMFLIAANFASINLSIENLEAVPYKAGGMTLQWNVIGDINNPFVLDWQIYRNIGTEGLLIPFNSLNDTSAEDWEQLTNGKLSDSIKINTPLILTSSETEIAVQCVDQLDSNDQNYSLEVENCYKQDFDQRWHDPKPLDADICASYVIVATNRQGETLWQNGGVSGIKENGLGEGVCGDNKAPLIILSNLNQEVIYDNSSSCLEENLDYSRCYSVKLKWNWPMTISESVDFKLYRTEQYVTDLQFAIPLETYESITPGASIEYIDTGTNVLTTYTDGEFENIEIDIGIRPDRVYYYYLAPTDALGNERTSPIQGNWVEVQVDEVSVSEYHPEWIPPPPAPPETITGTDFEAELLDYLEKSTFQVAGLITIIIICLNCVLIPYSIQQRKKASRRIDHLIKSGAWDMYEEDEDDY